MLSSARQSKRLYIGGVPEAVTEDELLKFFNDLMKEHEFAADMPGDPIAQAQINADKSFAFLEVSLHFLIDVTKLTGVVS